MRISFIGYSKFQGSKKLANYLVQRFLDHTNIKPTLVQHTGILRPVGESVFKTFYPTGVKVRCMPFNKPSITNSLIIPSSDLIVLVWDYNNRSDLMFIKQLAEYRLKHKSLRPIFWEVRAYYDPTCQTPEEAARMATIREISDIGELLILPGIK